IQMYRLLQGDVGSGKTIVAAGAIVAAQSADVQSAFMAPTEILAEQHFQNLQDIYQLFDIKVVLLTSSTSTKERRELLEDLMNVKVECVRGTHALIEEDVISRDLGQVNMD